MDVSSAPEPPLARRVSRVVQSMRDQTPEAIAAATHLHHLVLGPGAALEAEWRAAGLQLPDLEAMREYRVQRVRDELRARNLAGVLVMDPLNIRYLTDATNMQVWVTHNAARYAWLGVDGPLILWDYDNCDFLAGHSRVVDEVRPAIGMTYFLAGPRQEEKAVAWAAEIIDVVELGTGKGAHIAVDQCHLAGYRALEGAGITLASGQALMEHARVVKGPDEILAMRCATEACVATMREMRAAVTPGMTEREAWAMLHAGNIRRAGEWIETQLLSSGPRTNPWFQEASSRVMEPGDLLAYDTDLVGAYGMMVDISRTWVLGERAPTPAQARIHGLAEAQIERNLTLLTPGRTFRELTFDAWTPPVEDYRHYSCLYHGVGQCDEYPEIFFPHAWESSGFDGELVPGMVLSVESYVGSRAGGEGVKLEEQVLVTEKGPERLSAGMSLSLA